MNHVELRDTDASELPPVRVAVCDDGTRRVVAISGSLLIAHAWRVRELDLEHAGTPVVVDLGDVSELDAAGVAAVVSFARRVFSEGAVVTIEPPVAPIAAQAAAMTGMFDLVNRQACLVA